MWGASVPVPLPLLSATRRAGTGVGGSLGTSRGATGLLPGSQCAWQPRLTWSACLANAALYSWLALLHSSKQMFASSLILPFVQREENQGQLLKQRQILAFSALRTAVSCRCGLKIFLNALKQAQFCNPFCLLGSHQARG